MTHSTKYSKSFQNKAHRNQSSWCMHRLNTFSKAFTNGCFEMTGAQTDRHVYFSLFAFLSSYPLSQRAASRTSRLRLCTPRCPQAAAPEQPTTTWPTEPGVPRRWRSCCPNRRRPASPPSCARCCVPSGPTSSSARRTSCYRTSSPSSTHSCSGRTAANAKAVLTRGFIESSV